jgi:hypothetical protein
MIRFAIKERILFLGGQKTRVMLRLDLCGQNVDIVLGTIVSTSAYEVFGHSRYTL